MKYIILFLVISFACIKGSSQELNTDYFFEARYIMSYQPDSTEYKTAEEFMSLYVGNEQSLFCSSNYPLMDSAVSAELNRGNRMGPSLAFLNSSGTKYHDVIFKTSEKIILYEMIAAYIFEPYYYEEAKEPLPWKISADTLNIAGLNCQKAELNFGNKKWIAWFTTSIPVPEGPFKFYGLPGLIVKINDLKQYWNFTLTEYGAINKKIKINFLGKKPRPIKDKERFLEQKRFYRDNRLQVMEQRGWKFPDRAKSEIAEKERARKDNNWIELYKP